MGVRDEGGPACPAQPRHTCLRKPPVLVEGTLQQVPFLELHGEVTQFVGQADDAIIAMSSYRLHIRFKESVVNVPLMLIESVQCRDQLQLHIICKDCKVIRCQFSSVEQCQEWARRLTGAVRPPSRLEELFSFAFHAGCVDVCAGHREQPGDTCRPGDHVTSRFRNEVERMGFDIPGVWRISEINRKYRLCSSYPQLLLVPGWITDAELESVAAFRSWKRFPTVLYRHQSSGAVIARCAQPEVSWWGWRNADDERLVQSIAKACAADRRAHKRVATGTAAHQRGYRGVSHDHTNGSDLHQLAEGSDLHQLTNGSDLHQLPNQRDLQEHTNGSVLQEHTNGSVLQEHTNGSVLQEHTNGSVLQEHTNGSVSQEHTNGRGSQDRTNGSLALECTTRTVVYKHVSGNVSQEHVNGGILEEHTDESVLHKCTNGSVLLEHTNGTLANTNIPNEAIVHERTNGTLLSHGEFDAPVSQGPEGDLADALPQKLLILDARSYAAAVANRAKGGGCECPEYYPNCEVMFMGMANIHSIRKSFQALRLLCSQMPDPANWLSALENTRWLQHLSLLLKAALQVVTAVDRDRRPVLVHCSDGWDRTPQIVALSKLLLDPYYRTVEGFQVLVETEWLDFGHKFGDRCGHGEKADDPNERCPVFLQWLDCVHQLHRQFPCSFQFNESFLVKLGQHTYSCLFGTFLCNSGRERDEGRVQERTCSLWSLMRPTNPAFQNILYSAHSETVLRPVCHVRSLMLWSAVYLPSSLPTTPTEDSCAPSPIPSPSEASRTPYPILSPSEVSCTPNPTPPPSNDSCAPNPIPSPSEASSTPCPTPTPSASPEEVRLGSRLLKTRFMGTLPSESEDGATPNRSSSDPNLENKCLDHHYLSQELSQEVGLDKGGANYPQGAGQPGSRPSEELGRERVAGEGFVEEEELKAAASEDEGAEPPVEECTEEAELSVPMGVAEGQMENILQEATEDDEECTAEPKYPLEPSLAPPSSPPRAPPTHLSLEDSEGPETQECERQVGERERVPEMSVSPERPEDSRALSAGAVRANGHTEITTETLTEVGGVSSEALGHLPPCSSPPHCLNTGTRCEAEPGEGRGLQRKPAQLCNRAPLCNGVPRQDGASGDHSPPASPPGAPPRCPQDGLALHSDAMQLRLRQMEAGHQLQVHTLKRQVQELWNRLESHHGNSHSGDQQACSADSDCRVDSPCLKHTQLFSEPSWGQLEQQDTEVTQWYPDRPANHCYGCQGRFWLATRKHHCRGKQPVEEAWTCGNVFCPSCCEQRVPAPCQACLSALPPADLELEKPIAASSN